MNNLPINHEYRKFRIILVGAGGTGGNVGPMIARLIADNENIELLIADGDEVEVSNLLRQPYLEGDVGLNKAQILSEKLNAAFAINSTFFPQYISSVNDLDNLFKKGRSTPKDRLDILISAVDNHKARSIMEEYFSRNDTLIYIDSANEDYFGDVILGLKVSGEVFLKTRGMYRPLEVFKKTKRVKKRSCEKKINDNPQYYPTNVQASTIILKMISDIVVESSIQTHFVNFDTHDYMMFSGPEAIEVDCEENYLKFISNPIKDKK